MRMSTLGIKNQIDRACVPFTYQTVFEGPCRLDFLLGVALLNGGLERTVPSRTIEVLVEANDSDAICSL